MTHTVESVPWLRGAVGQLLGPTSFEGDHGSPDWMAVREAARRHNLEPLLFDLVEKGSVSVPASVREVWEGQYYRNQIFNLPLLETAAKLLEATARAGVEPIVLKGPVSIARRWKDAGLRVMVDLDLLCRQRDLEVLAETARAQGFSAVGENATYHLTLQHPKLGAGLELHFDLYEVLSARAAFIDNVFDTSERLELEEFSFRAPAAAADAVLQLAHIVHHDQRIDLRHWLDFALAVQEVGRSDELGRLLSLTDLEPELEENLAVASRLFGVDLGARPAEPKPEVMMAVEASLSDLEDRRALLAGARMFPGWWSRAGYLARLLVPSPGRWRALAVTEGTGVGTALVRHMRRAVGRGRRKIEVRHDAVPPGDSPRARLFRRRRGPRRSGSRPGSR